MNLVNRVPALVLMALMLKAWAAQAEVVLPCPLLKPGSSWQYAGKMPMGPATTHTLVTAANGKTIIVSEKMIMDAAAAGMRGSDFQQPLPSQEIEYENTGSTIVRRAYTSGGMRVSVAPPDIFCGKLPSEWQYTAKSIANGVTTLTHSKATARFIGKEKITVPSGTFDATVVEIRRQDSPSGQTVPGGAGFSTVQLIHAVENVGFVKVAITTRHSVPHAGAAADPRAQALMQEGLRKMQQGQDATDVMQQLAATSGEIQNEVIIVLKSFVIP